MSDTTSREKVLKKIRKALITKSIVEYSNVDFDSEIYQAPVEPLELIFAQQLTKLNGKFIFCENNSEFIEVLGGLIKEHEWKNVFCLEPFIKDLLTNGKIHFSSEEKDLITTDIGITGCESLVARTGSVLVSSRQASGRRLPVYANIHIVVAYTSQLVYHIKDALKLIRTTYGDQIPSMITTITGPSRTADIEKTLVQGAHGPKEIFVILVDDAN